jgi:hypothetical protein
MRVKKTYGAKFPKESYKALQDLKKLRDRESKGEERIGAVVEEILRHVPAVSQLSMRRFIEEHGFSLPQWWQTILVDSVLSCSRVCD